MRMRPFAAISSLVLLPALLVAWPAGAIPPVQTDPPDFQLPCDGGPIDVGASIVLDYGRSVRLVRTAPPNPGSGFLPGASDFDALGDRDVVHLVQAGGFDPRREAECPANPLVFRLGALSCSCLRDDFTACDVRGNQFPEPADLYTCPPDATHCCTAPEDGLALLACRDLTATLGVIELDVDLGYLASGAQQPHMYVGTIAVDGSGETHQWFGLDSDHGHLPPGAHESPGELQRRHLNDSSPGRTYPPGRRGAKPPEPRHVGATLQLLPGVQHYVQLTVVEGSPEAIGTPPAGVLGAGETESYLLLPEVIPGGGILISLLPDGPGGALATCSGSN